MSHEFSLTSIPDLNSRYDIYGAVHKGLRKAGCDLLGRLGTADFQNAEETGFLIDDLRNYLMLAASHVNHEDDHIHVALAAKGVSTVTLDEQHDDHRTAFHELEELIAAWERAQPLHKPGCGRKLYLAFAAYIADDFAHMHEEETVTGPLLWRNFTDDEMLGIEMRIIASLPPEKSMAFMRIMIPAINPAERRALLGAMKRDAPPEIFQAVIDFAVRPGLSARDFAQLADALKLAA
ncbi:hemerythrin domain-containing protein [Rhizobium mongolense]|uniref:hemerythrin domain-containing protein n=1 Tax=Rhizobium mongolense TaxID=57676 RepID=UPI0034A43F8B